MSSLTRSKYLTESETRELLEACLMAPCRDSIMLELKLRTGCRASELLSLRPLDVSIRPDGHAEVFVGGPNRKKRSNDRVVLLDKGLTKRLNQYIQDAALTRDAKLFPIKYRRLNQIWHDWTAFGKVPHSLRHTFAVRLCEKSKDIRLIQYCLGHKKLTTTEIYLTHVQNVDAQKEYLDAESTASSKTRHR